MSASLITGEGVHYIAETTGDLARITRLADGCRVVASARWSSDQLAWIYHEHTYPSLHDVMQAVDKETHR